MTYASVGPTVQVGLIALGKLSFLGISVLLYKSLSLSEMGLFSLIYAIAVILSTISECGLRGLLVRELSRSREDLQDAEHLMAGALNARLLTLLPYLAVGLALGWIFAPNTNATVLLALLCAAWLDSNSTVFRGALRAYDHIVLDAAIAGASRLALLAATAWLFHVGVLDLESFATVFLGITVVDMAITLTLVTIKTRVPLSLKSNTRQTLLMIRRGLPFIIITIIGIIHLRVAVLVLSLFPSETSLDEVAAFNLSGRIPEGVAFIPIALMNASLPFIARNVGNIDVVLPTFRKLERVLGSAGLMLGIGVYYFAEELITFMATPGYLQYKHSFQLYGFTIFFSFVQYVNINLLIGLNYERRVAKRYGAVLILHVILSLSLVWSMGLYGAVLALAFCEIAAVVVDWKFLAEKDITPQSSTLAIWTVVALGSALTAWIASALGDTAGLIVYFIITAAAGALMLGQAQLSHIVTTKA